MYFWEDHGQNYSRGNTYLGHEVHKLLRFMRNQKICDSNNLIRKLTQYSLRDFSNQNLERFLRGPEEAIHHIKCFRRDP